MVRKFLLAVSAAVLAVAGFGGATAVHASVTCPSGSQTLDMQENSPEVVQNADNYGLNKNPPISTTDSCFSTTGSSGQLTVTQADNCGNSGSGCADSTDPTSYPSDHYGCGTTYCSASWTTEDWDQSSPLKISASFGNSGVSGSDVYDYLLDNLFTSSGNTGTNPPIDAEVEVILYTNSGGCVATSCGALEETVDGVQWWVRATVAPGAWPDIIFIRNVATSSVTNLNMTNFYTAANTYVNPPCQNSCSILHGYLQSSTFPYPDYLLSSTWQGTELWPRTAGDGGLGVSVTSQSITNEP